MLEPPAALPPDPAWQCLARAAGEGLPGSCGPVIGLACSRLPEELPRALGLHPWRVRPVPEPPVRASALLQGFGCSFLQNLLHQGLGDELQFLAGLTLPANTCDSMRSFPAIWRASGARPARIFSLRLPARLEGAAARSLLEAELRGWLGWLEELAGHPLERPRLEATVRSTNRQRAALRGLRVLAGAGRIPFSLVDLAAEGARALPLEEAVAQLEAAREAVASRPPLAGPVRLALLGGLLELSPLLAWLEAHGAQLVLEDTCVLGRMNEEQRDLDPTRPLEDLAGRLLACQPCPVAAGSAARRLRRLEDRAASLGLQGVLLCRYRGCEPHAFDGVLLASGLERAGLPQLGLELEPGQPISGQTATRLEAFLEMISGLPVE